MAEYNVSLPLNQKTPGAITTTKQVLDLTKVGPKQLQRCVDAARAGFAPREGYVRTILDACAKAGGLMRPLYLDVSKYSRSIAVYGFAVEVEVDDLIKLSDVRHQMWLAANLPTLAPWQQTEYAKCKSSWHWNDWQTNYYLELFGWDPADLPQVKGMVDEAIARSDIAEDREKLAQFVETRPVLEIFDATVRGG